MARRRRGEKRRQRELELLQVELLAEQDDGSSPEDASSGDLPGEGGKARDDVAGESGQASAASEGEASPKDVAPRPHTVDEAPPEETPTDEAFPVAGSSPSDRWLRALGRRGAARGVDPDGSLPSSEALRRAINALERQETARNHAAARVRPAGEPLAKAKDLVQQGRVDEAIELYLGILTVNPSNLKARNNLGVLLDELRLYEEALEHLAAAERLAPENVEVLTNFASTLTSLARYDEAEALLRRAQKINAEGLEVRLAIGILYFRRGLYAQAEADLRWVCARDRNNGRAFYYRGEALNRLGRFDEARQAMERARVLLPNDPRPYYTLGHLYDRQHQAEEAAEMYREARRLQER